MRRCVQSKLMQHPPGESASGRTGDPVRIVMVASARQRTLETCVLLQGNGNRFPGGIEVELKRVGIAMAGHIDHNIVVDDAAQGGK
ncbi:MAG: hypothetical protein AB9869_23580 [Verrucomicrobiia bacterium]